MSCAICLEEFADGAKNTVHLPCAHTFHTECFFEYVRVLKFACPMCRREFEHVRKVTSSYSTAPNYVQYLERSTFKLREDLLVTQNLLLRAYEKIVKLENEHTK